MRKKLLKNINIKATHQLLLRYDYINLKITRMKKKIIVLTGVVILSFSCKKETTSPTIDSNNSKVEVIPKGKYSTPIKDVDGNSYKTVQIGTQIWMAENLKTSRYNDETEIPSVKDNPNLLSINRGWSEYNNDPALGSKYGKLYDWYTIDKASNENKNICPNGWHLPSIEEWKTLVNYLGGNEVAGNNLKAVGTENWLTSDQTTTNAALFDALPGGESFIPNTDQTLFEKLGSTGTWWSYDYEESNYDVAALAIILSTGNGKINYRNAYKREGLSVRCLKD